MAKRLMKGAASKAVRNPSVSQSIFGKLTSFFSPPVIQNLVLRIRVADDQFTHVVDGGMTVSELTNSIIARYNELFPGKLSGKIDHLADEKHFDLDGKLRIRDVLQTGDIVEAVILTDKARPPPGGNAHLTSGIRPLDLDMTDAAFVEYKYSGGPIPPFPGFYVGFDLLQSSLDGFVNSMLRQRCNEANPALVILGGSKSGKSTLLRSVLPSYLLRQPQLKLTKFLVLDGTGITQTKAEGILREFLYLLRNAVKDCFIGVDILPHSAETAHGTKEQKADPRELIRDVCRRLDSLTHETVILIDDSQRLFEGQTVEDTVELTKFFASLINAPSTRGQLRFGLAMHTLHALGYVLDATTYPDAVEFLRSGSIKAVIPLQTSDVYLKLSAACLCQKFKLARTVSIPFFDKLAAGSPARQATIVDRYKLIRLTQPQDPVAMCASQALGHVSDDLISSTRRELNTFLARNDREGRGAQNRLFLDALIELTRGGKVTELTKYSCHRWLKDTVLETNPEDRTVVLNDMSLKHLLRWMTSDLVPEPTASNLHGEHFFSLETARLLDVAASAAKRLPSWDDKQRKQFEVLSLQHFSSNSPQTADLTADELWAQLEIDMRQDGPVAMPYEPVRALLHELISLPELNEREAVITADNYAKCSQVWFASLLETIAYAVEHLGFPVGQNAIAVALEDCFEGNVVQARSWIALAELVD